MDTYLSSQTEAINILRESGYTNDFELFGRELLCIQQKVFIREADYFVTMCYRIINDEYYDPAVILLGITTFNGNVKGILINTYCNYIRIRPPVIIKKLAEYYTRCGEVNINSERKEDYFTTGLHVRRQRSIK